MRRIIVLVVAFLVASLTLSACTDLVAGDSLVVNAAMTDPGVSSVVEPVRRSTSQVDGVALRGISGIAPCDYRTLVASDVATWHPRRVTLAFSGNNGNPCMQDSSGRGLTGPGMIARYRTDLVWLTQYLVSHGASVIYSAPACVAPGLTRSNGDPALRTMERDLAASFARQRQHVAYSEYAARQLCPNWTYVPSFRAVDGLHLSGSGSRVFAAALRYENKHTVIP